MTTTKAERQDWVSQNKEQFGKEFGGSAVLLLLSILATFAMLITWGFGADRMIWVALASFLFSAWVLFNLRRNTKRYVEHQINRERVSWVTVANAGSKRAATASTRPHVRWPKTASPQSPNALKSQGRQQGCRTMRTQGSNRDGYFCSD